MSTRNRRARTVRTGPARPRVLAAYLRLTEDRNGNKIGYEAQWEAIERYAKAMGFQLVPFKDKDLTAAVREVNRPEYEKMLKRVAAGEFAGIVVWRLDRLVRLNREFERCFGIVADAGACIIEASTGISTANDAGKFIMRTLVSVAEMEIDAMRARARAHQNLRAKKGLLSTGGARPFGFVGIEKNRDGVITNRGRAGITHHPIEASLARDAAERIAFHGATYNDIAREWGQLDTPIVGTEGGTFGGDRVREILTSPRIAGKREYDLFDDDGEFAGTDFAKAVWEPVIPEATWEILRSRAKAGARGPRTTRSEYLLTDGVAKCGTCGRAMIGTTIPDTRTGGRLPAYRCNASVPARKAGSCGKPIVRADYLENVVLQRLFARLDASPALHDLADADGDGDAAAEREVAIKEIKLCEEKLSELGARTALREDDPRYLSEPESAGRAAEFRKRRQEAQKALQEAVTETTRPTPSDEDRSDIEGWFKRLSLGGRRSWLAVHIPEVFVDPVRRRLPTFDESRVRTPFADAKNRP